MIHGLRFRVVASPGIPEGGMMLIARLDHGFQITNAAAVHWISDAELAEMQQRALEQLGLSSYCPRS